VESLVADEEFKLALQNIAEVFAFMLDRAVTHDMLWDDVHTRLEQRGARDRRQKLHFDRGAAGNPCLGECRALTGARDEIVRRILEQGTYVRARRRYEPMQESERGRNLAVLNFGNHALGATGLVRNILDPQAAGEAGMPQFSSELHHVYLDLMSKFAGFPTFLILIITNYNDFKRTFRLDSDRGSDDITTCAGNFRYTQDSILSGKSFS
jgi:hypothetical protein